MTSVTEWREVAEARAVVKGQGSIHKRLSRDVTVTNVYRRCSCSPALSVPSQPSISRWPWTWETRAVPHLHGPVHCCPGLATARSQWCFHLVAWVLPFILSSVPVLSSASHGPVLMASVGHFTGPSSGGHKAEASKSG